MRNDCVWVDVESVARETDKAIYVLTDSGEAWIAKSQISDDSEVFGEGDYGWLGIPRWLAEDKDLHYEEEI